MAKIEYGGVDPNSAQRVGHSLIDRKVFTANGTYTPTAGMRFVIVEVVGGGGGGGGTAATGAGTQSSAGGGGGGGYSSKKILSGAIGTTETVTVGTGGIAATAGANAGGTGVTSSFGTHCSATGGVGGLGSAATAGSLNTDGGVGGLGASGDININGDGGQNGEVIAGIRNATGNGGGTKFSGTARQPTFNSNGTVGNVYGGGASGAISSVSQAARVSTAGADGIIIVWEYGDILVGSGPAANVILRNHIDGLIMSNNGTDAVNDIDISAGVCRDNANLRTMSLTAAITKQIDIDWAEGNNAGGFPSALTLTNDTWYHVFVIGKVDGTLDAGFDTSLTATNLLSDASAYTDYRRVGSVRRGTALNVLFDQNGDEFVLDVPVRDVNNTTTGTAANLAALTAPPNTVAHFSGFAANALVVGYYLFTSVSQTDTAPSATVADLFTSTTSTQNQGQFQLKVDGISQIRYRSEVTGTVIIFTKGWTDTRGKQ